VAGERPDVRAIVLAAEGTAFCAGANLNWMRRMADYTATRTCRTRALWPRCCAIYECPKPTIARVQGDVYAGGMGLVAACDMAVAAENAGFCLSEVKIGLMPGTISPYVMRAMGARAGHRYFLTGERFDAAEALRIGFVHQVVAADSWTTPWTACSRRCWWPGPRCAPARSWCWTWPSAKSTPN
jgi:methylglutaconyl-CoA hydratase